LSIVSITKFISPQIYVFYLCIFSTLINFVEKLELFCMDSEFFKVLVAIGLIALSVFTSAHKKQKKGNSQPKPPFSQLAPMQRNPQRPQQQPMPAQQPMPEQEQRPQPVQAAQAKAYAPARAAKPARLPEEGGRVTTKRMAPNPQKKGTAIFNSKDDLRRAIILGEVLAPKF